MSWKRIATVAAVVLIGGAFLAGYLPERRLRTAAEREVSRLCASSSRRRRLVSGWANFSVRRWRYESGDASELGQAQDLSSSFFDSIRVEATATPLNEFRDVLNDVLSRETQSRHHSLRRSLESLRGCMTLKSGCAVPWAIRFRQNLPSSSGALRSSALDVTRCGAGSRGVDRPGAVQRQKDSAS